MLAILRGQSAMASIAANVDTRGRIVHVQNEMSAQITNTYRELLQLPTIFNVRMGR